MLHELAATQMEHELREDREFGGETEGVGVVGAVVREFRAEPNQRAVDPAQNVRHGLRFTPLPAPTSSSKRCVARRAMITAAHSWSNDAATGCMCAKSMCQPPLTVVTRRRSRPLGCV